MDINLKIILFIPLWVIVMMFVVAVTEFVFPQVDIEKPIPKICINTISIGIDILILCLI